MYFLEFPPRHPPSSPSPSSNLLFPKPFRTIRVSVTLDSSRRFNGHSLRGNSFHSLSTLLLPPPWLSPAFPQSVPFSSSLISRCVSRSRKRHEMDQIGLVGKWGRGEEGNDRSNRVEIVVVFLEEIRSREIFSWDGWLRGWKFKIIKMDFGKSNLEI